MAIPVLAWPDIPGGCTLLSRAALKGARKTSGRRSSTAELPQPATESGLRQLSRLFWGGSPTTSYWLSLNCLVAGFLNSEPKSLNRGQSLLLVYPRTTRVWTCGFGAGTQVLDVSRVSGEAAGVSLPHGRGLCSGVAREIIPTVAGRNPLHTT